MKYDKTLTDQIVLDYLSGMTVTQIAEKLTKQLFEAKQEADRSIGSPEERCGLGSEVVPDRSIIAKLSSLGVYKKKVYTTKRGEIPIKKEEYIDRIAILLGVPPDTLESMEKCNKSVLAMLDTALQLNATPIIN